MRTPLPGSVFDFSPLDVASLRRDFTITGTPTIVDGGFGKGCYFNGSSYLYVVNWKRLGALMNGTNIFSFGVRFQTTELNTVVLSQAEVSLDAGFVKLVNGKIVVTAFQGTLVSSGTYNDGEPHTVYLVRDTPSTQKCYIDGNAEILSGSTVGKSNESLTFYRLGADFAGNYFIGTIYEFKLFSRALSATEALNISRGDPFPYLRNIVSLWKPAANGALIDVIGGNDGTPVNIDASNVVDGPWGRKALSLNGSDELETAPSTKYNLGEFTFVVGVRHDSSNTNGGWISIPSGSDSGNDYDVGGISLGVRTGKFACEPYFSDGGDMAANNWYNRQIIVAMTYSDVLDQYSAFINGSLIVSGTRASYPIASTGLLRIGARMYSSTLQKWAKARFSSIAAIRSSITQLEAARIAQDMKRGGL